MMIEQRTRIFGTAILGITLLQGGLYTVASRLGQQAGYLQYFDPRIGIAGLTDLPERGFPNYLEWSSVLVLASVAGFTIVRPSKRSLRVYLLAEAGLSVPTLAFFVVVLQANLAPAHGFSLGELTWPLAVFVVLSLTPWLTGYRLLDSWRRAG
jgi:hypothetical protein